MRYLFWFWVVPMSILWGWFGLSANNISFGIPFLTRRNHDVTFMIYEQLTGLSKPEVVDMLVKMCIFDSLLIFAIFAFRKRRDIKAWWVSRNAARQDAPQDQPSVAAAPAE